MEIRVEIKEIVINVIMPEPQENAPESTTVDVQCSHCGWKKSYPNAKTARRGLAAHQRHCPGEPEEISRLQRMMGLDGD